MAVHASSRCFFDTISLPQTSVHEASPSPTPSGDLNDEEEISPEGKTHTAPPTAESYWSKIPHNCILNTTCVLIGCWCFVIFHTHSLLSERQWCSVVCHHGEVQSGKSHWRWKLCCRPRVYGEVLCHIHTHTHYRKLIYLLAVHGVDLMSFVFMSGLQDRSMRWRS